MPVERAGSLLGLNRGSHYRDAATATTERPTSQRPQEGSLSLRAAVERVVLEFPGYGYRRVTKHRQREGWPVNRKRVLRVLREERRRCPLKRRWTKTTDRAHGWRVYPNRLADRGGRHLTRRDEAWVADLTYIRLGGEFVYRATGMDASSI